jgi:hypothetical protein
LKLFLFTILILNVVCALLGPAAIGAVQPISHQAGPVTPQRAVSEEWVGFLNRGNQRAACELQTVADVNGQPCTTLSTGQLLHCPLVPVGPKKKSRRESELRRVFEQVGSITEEGADRAFAVLNSQRKTSRWRGALGLEQLRGTWRVSYLRQGEDTYVPAGAVWMTEAWRKLWYPPTCPQLR